MPLALQNAKVSAPSPSFVFAYCKEPGTGEAEAPSVTRRRGTTASPFAAGVACRGFAR